MKEEKKRRCAMCKNTEWVAHKKRGYLACSACGYSRLAFDWVPKSKSVRFENGNLFIIDDPCMDKMR